MEIRKILRTAQYCFGVLFISGALLSCNASDSTQNATSETEQVNTTAENAVFVDVRTPEEFSSGHVDGATNIPVDEIERITEEIPDKDTPIVLYCRSGGRAGRALKALTTLGYTDVVNAGGVNDAKKLKGK